MPEGARLQKVHLEDAIDGERGDVLTGHAAHLHQMLKGKQSDRVVPTGYTRNVSSVNLVIKDSADILDQFRHLDHLLPTRGEHGCYREEPDDVSADLGGHILYLGART